VSEPLLVAQQDDGGTHVNPNNHLASLYQANIFHPRSTKPNSHISCKVLSLNTIFSHPRHERIMSNYNNTSNIPTSGDDNPWADPARDNLRPTQGHQQQSLNPQDTTNNPFYQQSNSPNPWQLNQGQDSTYAPPPGPPPGHNGGYQPQQAWSQPDQNNPFAQQPQQHQYQQQNFTPGGLNKAPTFNENDFVPADERGEQREAMEQFEITNSRPQSTDDRNVETLQQEFPALDGSLVAAIYMDSKQMGAVREMLRELNGGS